MFKYLSIINIINNARIFLGVKLRYFFLTRKLVSLKNKDFTMLTENCLAGVIYHDFRMQFCTPLINGEFSTEDFIKFLEKPKFYMMQDLVFTSCKDESLPDFYREKDCPIASLGDLHYRFTHYQMSVEDIRRIWNKRKERINWDNLYVVLCEKRGCTLEHMKRFETLPYEHKLILTCHYYPELKHAFQVKGFEEIGYIDNLLKNMPGIFPTAKRFYDQFDFVTWLNTGKIRRV